MKRALSLLSLSWAWAQLSGIVNTYAAVTSFGDPKTLQVDDATGFAPGDRVLVYQAKGATIDPSNSSAYGDVTAIGGAGLFEFGSVQTVTGNTLVLTCPLTRPFSFGDPVGAAIQVVRVSYHPGNVSITGTVTAPPWNGQKGGLVVIETEGTLTFGANIDVRGKGFRGGDRSLNGGSSSACNAGTYYGAADDQAGRKGEGVANWPSINHYGYRGKLANGGGGGNNHNCGGGGGGNYGAGGTGGWTTCGSRWFCSGTSVSNSGIGLGGLSLSSYLDAANPRLFFGGGGGGGHHNNDQGGVGGPGGGIVLLRATQIVGNGWQILASGAQGVQNLGGGCGQTNVSFAGNDGAGGGGAGGAVALYCPTYVGTLTLDVRGANGQNCSSHLCSCTPDHGPGGGGGGGYAWLSTAALPPGLTVLATGGQNGIELTPLNENQYGCTNTGNCIPAGPDRYNRGATPGQNGASLYNLSWTPVSSCPLPYLRLQAWQAQVDRTGQVHHRWQIATDLPLTAIEIHIQPQASSTPAQVVAFPPMPIGEGTHPLPHEGTYTLSLQVRLDGGAARPLATYTLSWHKPFTLTNHRLVLTGSPGEPFALYDATGKLLLLGSLPQTQPYEIDLTLYPPGLYLLRIGTASYKLLLER